MSNSKITMYTTTWCSDCKIAKRVLTEKGIPFIEVNIEDDDKAVEYVMKVNDGRRSVPTLVYGKVAASLSQFTPTKLETFLTESGLN